MNSLKPLIFILTIASLSAILRCSNGKIKNVQGRILEYPGKYILFDSLQLTIKREHGFIRYILNNGNGYKLLQSDDNISSFQTWGFYMDDYQNLWIHSSDIGDAVWIRKDSGYHKKYLTQNDEMNNAIPQKFKDYINGNHDNQER